MSEIQIKDYFERRLVDLEEHLRSIRSGDREALKLQAIEYERRLEALNGEQAKISGLERNYVKLDMFNTKHDQVVDAIAELKIYRANIEGRMWGIAIIIGVVFSAISFLLARFWK